MTTDEKKKVYDILQNWWKKKVRKAKHGTKYKLLIPLKKTHIENGNRRKKASDKFSIKQNDSNKNKKRKNEENKVMAQQSGPKKQKRKLNKN